MLGKPKRQSPGLKRLGLFLCNDPSDRAGVRLLDYGDAGCLLPRKHNLNTGQTLFLHDGNIFMTHLTCIMWTSWTALLSPANKTSAKIKPVKHWHEKPGQLIQLYRKTKKSMKVWQHERPYRKTKKFMKMWRRVKGINGCFAEYRRTRVWENME